jgi:tRNA (Thr-GGU) A37 N-methylase
VPHAKRATCSECGLRRAEDKTCVIDGAVVCHRCLFGETRPVRLHPIGFVANGQQRDESDFGMRDRASTSRIELLPSQARFMHRLDEEESLTIVYHLHRARAIRSRFERGLDGKEVGVFASRTPDRPTPIGIQDVRLVGVEGTTLLVEGLDAIDGTPVLDIKLGRSRD